MPDTVLAARHTTVNKSRLRLQAGSASVQLFFPMTPTTNNHLCLFPTLFQSFHSLSLSWESFISNQSCYFQKNYFSTVSIVPLKTNSLEQGCQTHFHQGPHQTPGCLQRAKCNFRSVSM